MSNDNKIKFSLELDAGEYNKLLAKTTQTTADTVQETQGLFSRMKKGLDGIWIGVGSAMVNAFGQGIGAVKSFVTSTVQNFADFDKGMRQVFTLLPGMSADAMKQMSEQARKFSSETGQELGNVTKALYNALSAGVPKDNVFEFMRTANQAALAGATDLNTAVNTLSGTVNAYKEHGLTAQQASDAMFTAVRLGKTDFELLNKSINDVTPIASALGISFNQVSAAVAAMTLVNGDTAKTTTQLKALFSELTSTTNGAGKTFDILTGQSFPDFIKKGGTVEEAIQIMTKGAKGNMTTLSSWFSSQEAFNALLTLSKQNLKEHTAEVNKGTGETAKAAAVMEGSFSVAVSKLTTSFSNLLIKLLESSGATEWMTKTADWLTASLATMEQRVQSIKATYQEYKSELIAVAAGVTAYMTAVRLAAMWTAAKTTAVVAANAILLVYNGIIRVCSLAHTAYATTAAAGGVGAGLLAAGSSLAAMAVHALKFAIRGLMTATGVGIVIAGLTYLVERLMNATDGSADSLENFASAQKEAEDKARSANEQMKQAESEMKKADDAAKELEKQTKKLGDTSGGTATQLTQLGTATNTLTSSQDKLKGSVEETTGELIKQSEAIKDLQAAENSVIKKVNDRREEDRFTDIKRDDTPDKKNTEKYLSERITKNDAELKSLLDVVKRYKEYTTNGMTQATKEGKAEQEARMERINELDQQMTDDKNSIADIGKENADKKAEKQKDINDALKDAFDEVDNYDKREGETAKEQVSRQSHTKKRSEFLTDLGSDEDIVNARANNGDSRAKSTLATRAKAEKAKQKGDYSSASRLEKDYQAKQEKIATRERSRADASYLENEASDGDRKYTSQEKTALRKARDGLNQADTKEKREAVGGDLMKSAREQGSENLSGIANALGLSADKLSTAATAQGDASGKQAIAADATQSSAEGVSESSSTLGESSSTLGESATQTGESSTELSGAADQQKTATDTLASAAQQLSESVTTASTVFKALEGTASTFNETLAGVDTSIQSIQENVQSILSETSTAISDFASAQQEIASALKEVNSTLSSLSNALG